MKNIKTWLSAVVLLLSTQITSIAQTVNWASLNENQKHIINVNAGWDFGATLGAGYGYVFQGKFPTILNGTFSIPSGSNKLDDFKTALSLKTRLYKAGSFQASVQAQGIFRQLTTSLVKMNDFGSFFSGTAGYYRPRWFAAAEFGFDKAVTTRIRSTQVMRDNYPGTTDGWYVPTGGNFIYGIQAGVSISRVDATLRLGQTVDQTFRASAVVPKYVQLGINLRF